MAWELPVAKIPGIVAGADLRTKQYYGVKLDSAGKAILVASEGESAIGVLQNKPNTGEAAEIMAIGLTPVHSGAAISLPNFIQFDANGKAIAAATGGHHKVGYIVEAASGADVEVTAFVNCGTGVV